MVRLRNGLCFKSLFSDKLLGGKKIAGALGRKYLNYLISLIGRGVKGSADLVAFFFLRSGSLIRKPGMVGLIASNSISEGGTREVGLEQLKSNGFDIFHARSSEIWPGKANVVTSRVHLTNAKWKGEKILNQEIVRYISPYLTNRDNWEPVKLNKSSGLVHQGSVLLGNGFILDQSDAIEKVKNNERLKAVLFPYLSGQDVNRNPHHDSKRWVINFWDWSKEKAHDFAPDLFAILEKDVVAERSEMKSMGGAADTFWRHLWYRSELYHWLGYGPFYEDHPSGWIPDRDAPEKVLVFATGATKYPCFTFVPNKYIFANTLCVIANDSFSLFSCLSSDIHTIWAWEHGSRMKQDLRYTHGDVFETFPFPSGVLEGSNRKLVDLGKKYFDTRSRYMIDNDKGMTKFYNDLHDPSVNSESIIALRDLHVEINNTVLSSYGINDVELEHGFHEVAYLPEEKNIRFTMSEGAREELLYRLAILNKERNEDKLLR